MVGIIISYLFPISGWNKEQLNAKLHGINKTLQVSVLMKMKVPLDKILSLIVWWLKLSL